MVKKCDEVAYLVKIFMNTSEHQNAVYSSGQIVVIMLIIAMIIGIVIPGLIFLTQHEAKWTVKELKSTRAFHLAEAGIDRAVYKLNETSTGWNDAKAGNFPAGYDGTTTFTDVEGGSYKIKISSKYVTSLTTQIIIQSVATDLAQKEIRGLEIIYEKSSMEASILAVTGINVSAGSELHWGPCVSQEGNITLAGSAAADYFPRKFAGIGYRVIGTASYPRDPNLAGQAPDEGPDTRKAGLTPSDWVDASEKEWHSNSDAIEVTLEIEKYKTKAKNYSPPKGLKVKIGGPPDPNFTKADPPGSGYIPASAGLVDFYGGIGDSTSYRDYCSTAVYYIEGDCRIQNNAFIGPYDGTITTNSITLIVLGNMFLSGMGGLQPYTVKVPSGAYKEYQYFDTSATNQYPGDGGYRTCTASFTFETGGPFGPQWPNFHGVMYVNGNLDITGIQQLIGIVIVKGSISGAGTSKIYYNESVKENISYMASAWQKKSWLEFAPGSWSSPNW